MSACDLPAYFHDERAAIDFVEAHVWAGGRVCPHCGGRERHHRLAGKSTRLGVWKCYACRKPFTVRLGTLFESSHVPLHLWLRAISLLGAGEHAVSTQVLQRALGVTFKTAWCMKRRICASLTADASPATPAAGAPAFDRVLLQIARPNYTHTAPAARQN